mmetsp:Transcript_11904/g.27249  ORF Transcript_11904/g.27249 Transcript_11904/m.27249 type:complete len:82 (+) Transcript_11904:840-1085(+)
MIGSLRVVEKHLRELKDWTLMQRSGFFLSRSCFCPVFYGSAAVDVYYCGHLMLPEASSSLSLVSSSSFDCSSGGLAYVPVS